MTRGAPAGGAAARAHAETILARFDDVDTILVASGFPPTSPEWRAAIERWYRSGKRQLVARVGRRGGKSSTLCRLAVTEAIWGTHEIPPGDTGVIAIVSAHRDDAAARLVTIKAILDALRVDYVEAADTITLPLRNISFKVFTASIAGVSGFTSIFILLDEVAKWRDKRTSANPAREVLASIRPTAKTQKNARIALISSPMGWLDAHADAFAAGETKHQCVWYAPTWIANPTITEQDTHDDEPDPLIWEREYLAQPQAEEETSLYSTSLVDRAVRAEPLDIAPCPRHRYVATIDPATRGNAWTFVIATLSDGHVRKIVLAREWVGTRKTPLKPGDVFRQIAALLRPYGIKHVYSDQFAEDALREIARQHDLTLIVDMPWSASTKADAYDHLRTLFQESRIELPPDNVLKTDILGVRQKLTRNGVVYDLASQGPRHSDYAPAVAMAVMLAKVPATPIPTKLSNEEIAQKIKHDFLHERTRERKRNERVQRRSPLFHSIQINRSR